MIVVDASVLAVALLDEGDDGGRARDRLRNCHLVAPDLIYLEVASVLRRQIARGCLDARRARLALVDLEALPLSVAPQRPLLQRIWELRHALTPYDAAYVALAEMTGAALLTADKRIARSNGPRCSFEVLPG